MVPTMVSKVDVKRFFTCPDCGMAFSHASSMYRHRSARCMRSMREHNSYTSEQSDQSEQSYLDIRPSYDELCAQVQRLQDIVSQMTSVLSSIVKNDHASDTINGNNITVIKNTTINNTANTNINVHINAFGREKTGHITPDFLSSCVKAMDKGIVNLVKEKHFSNDHTVNRNIRIHSKKDKELASFDGEIWEVRPHKELLEHLFRVNTETLDNHFCDKEDTFKRHTKYKHIDDFFEKARNSDPETMDKVTKALFYLILNEGARESKRTKG